MHKTPFSHIDTGVRGCAAPEQHQVAHAQFARGDGLAEIIELRHRTWRRYASATLVDVANEAAAIKATVRCVAAIAVRRADEAHRMDGDVVRLLGRKA